MLKIEKEYLILIVLTLLINSGYFLSILQVAFISVEYVLFLKYLLIYIVVSLSPTLLAYGFYKKNSYMKLFGLILILISILTSYIK